MARIAKEAAGDKPAVEITPLDLDILIRGRLREAIEDILVEELDAALGVAKHERGAGRRGHRNGVRERTLTCQAGTTTVAVPRGRIFRDDRGSEEYRSRFVPYYQRRTRAVDEALLGAYVCGTSTRKVKHALAPLWKKGPLSKSTVSRLTPRLKARWEAFQERDLSERTWVYLYLDAIALRVRLAKKVVSVPVLVALGIDAEGRKELLALALRASESGDAWGEFCDDLRERGVRDAVLVIVDGSKGLCTAVATAWSAADLQRCTVHKERNLLNRAPRHAREEIKGDYRELVEAEGEKAARAAWRRFVRKWEKKLPAVVRSLEEGGEELLTFFRYPKSQWKCLRSTNAIERLIKEFRRRVKVQESLPDGDSAVALLHALWAEGCIAMRRVDGYRQLAQVVARSKGSRHAERKAA
ncbi:MAG: IS256 family transposase [Anaerolineae bacterium]